MLLVDSKKRIYWRYPKPGVHPPMPFRFDDDTFFGPNADRIISNQEDQQTIQILSFPAGRLLWRYGRVDIKGTRRGDLNTPDDAYLLRDKLVTVADAYNCRVLFISPAHRIVRQIGTTAVCRHDPPRYLGAINGATPLPNAGTLISEINGSWIDDVSRTGRLRWSVQAPVTYPSDPQLLTPNRILVADYARPGHVILMTRRGRVLWRYGPSAGPAALDHPSLATRIAPGLIAVNDDFRHRVVLISMKTKRIVWQYGHTDVAGRRSGYLNTPDGLDVLRTPAANARPAARALLAPRRRVVARRSITSGGGIVIRAAPFHLPAAVQREVAVPTGRRILIAGGLNASEQSTNGVFRLDPRNGSLVHLGTVPQPFHDGAGAVIGNRLLVFGGGSGASSPAVQAFDLRTHRGAVLSELPRPLSDLAAARVGNAVYIVGGYDGRRPRREIYRTTDGRHFTVVAHLPIGLRYPAVTTVGNTLVIAGGAAASGASAGVYTFVPGGRVRRIVDLPRGRGHAVALTFGTNVYLVGGVDANGRTVANVIALDPTTGRISPVAASVRVSDAAAVIVGAKGFIIGGATFGHAVEAVREVLPR